MAKAKARAPRPGTTPTAVAAKKNDGRGIYVGFNGDRWLWRDDGVTPKDVADLRRATGFGVAEIMLALQGKDGYSLDLDLGGGLIFLARRQAEGRWVSFDYATEGLSYATPLTLEAATDDVDDDDEDPTSPEA